MNQETIYFLDAPKNPSALKEVLLDYVSKNSPETFYNNGEKQCNRGRRRSLDDLLMLSNHYFPESTIKDLLNALKQINIDLKEKDQSIIVLLCSDINRFVLYNSLIQGRSYVDGDSRGENKAINGVFISSIDKIKPRNSQWSFNELIELMNE